MGKKSKKVRNTTAQGQPTAIRNVSHESQQPSQKRTEAEGRVFLEIVEELLSSDRIRGVPEHLRDPADLQKHLEPILALDSPNLSWLIPSLLEGLLQGGAAINLRARPHPSAEPWPILFWLVQWKFLARAFGWKGQDEIVAMVLAAPGIEVNAVAPSNGVNAAFMAVKYGSIHTMRLLIDAGINLQQRDVYNRTCLYNACEYPQADMLRLVLEHLPATEIFYNSQYTPEGRTYPISVADRIAGLYMSDSRSPADGRIAGPLSWNNLGGPPSIEDYAECLALVRQKGATLTAEGSETALLFIGAACGGRFRGPYVSELIELAQFLLGFQLPVALEQQVKDYDERKEAAEEKNETPEECSICLNPFQRATELYCGHSFCRQCIVDHGRSANGGCPLCRRPLAGDICGRSSSDTTPTTTDAGTGNISNDFLAREEEQLQGILNLSNDRIAEETKIQNLYSRFSSWTALRNKLIMSTKQGHDTAKTSNPLSITLDEGSRQMAGIGEALVELSSTANVVGDSLMISAPADGPALIEISIKGVSILANLSNNSRYTVVSASVVETFKIKRLEKLRSRKFRDGLTGKKIKSRNIVFTCLESFTFSLGGVEVTLRNAVEAAPSPSGIGVQLGQDFFLSAAYCVAETKIGGEAIDSRGDSSALYMRTDGLCSWPALECKAESLRYYSRDGKTSCLPLLHFNPNKNERVAVCTVKPDTVFTECNWCGRIFPEGMFECGVCAEAGTHVFYCDERCQSAAWKIHKMTSEAHR